MGRGLLGDFGEDGIEQAVSDRCRIDDHQLPEVRIDTVLERQVHQRGSGENRRSGSAAAGEDARSPPSLSRINRRISSAILSMVRPASSGLPRSLRVGRHPKKHNAIAKDSAAAMPRIANTSSRGAGQCAVQRIQQQVHLPGPTGSGLGKTLPQRLGRGRVEQRLRIVLDGVEQSSGQRPSQLVETVVSSPDRKPTVIITPITARPIMPPTER